MSAIYDYFEDGILLPDKTRYSTHYKDALLFWKLHDQKFHILSTLAKKYLGVPASSASVERMFSISGHILSSKRSSMSVRLFALLVFLKLNENFL
jgi:hypothetical protein